MFQGLALFEIKCTPTGAFAVLYIWTYTTIAHENGHGGYSQIEDMIATHLDKCYGKPLNGCVCEFSNILNDLRIMKDIHILDSSAAKNVYNEMGG